MTESITESNLVFANGGHVVIKPQNTAIRTAFAGLIVTITHSFFPVVISLLILSAKAHAGESSTTGFEAASPGHQQSTPAGVRFKLPDSWRLEFSTHILLIAPEGDLRIALFDGMEQTGASESIEAAWNSYSDTSMRNIKLSIPVAPANGWEEGLEIQFEAPPAEHKAVRAWAFRRGEGWTVAILDGSLDTLDKQSAAVDLVLDGLAAPGDNAENFSGLEPNKLTPKRIQYLEQFLLDSMKRLGIPGSAVALVADGKVIYESGLGIRTVGETGLVNEHTRFMIASNTKPLTTLLLARMVDEGLMTWDQPVREVFPEFRLGTDKVSQEMQVRHLVCACTGLPRQDYGWIFATNKNTRAQDTFVQLAAMQVTSGFGEVFQYSNLLASAGGYVAGYAAFPGREPGGAYDDAMRKWTLSPMGMFETTFSMDEALQGNHANPHGPDLEGIPSRASLQLNYAIVPFRPAGGAWSTAHDMARYVQTELSLGQAPDGRRVVSEQNMRLRRARGISSGNDMWYGMGIEEAQVSGISVYRHGGSLPGFTSDFYVMPETGIGAVLLTNSSTGGLLLDPFLRRLIETLYDAPTRAVDEVASAASRLGLRIQERRASMTVPPPDEIVSQLSAAYFHPSLGQILVNTNSAETRLDFGLWSSAVGSRRNSDGTVSLLTIDPTVDRFEFLLGYQDGTPTLVAREAQHEYVFLAAEPDKP